MDEQIQVKSHFGIQNYSCGNLVKVLYDKLLSRKLYKALDDEGLSTDLCS